MAWYFFTDDFASCWRIDKTSFIGSGAAFIIDATAALVRLLANTPLAFNHCCNCWTLFGFSILVSSRIRLFSAAWERSSASMARRTSPISNKTPLSLIVWSWWYSCQKVSGRGWFASFMCISISAFTSRRLYSQKAHHLSGAWRGRLRVRIPLAFVGLQGILKKRIKVSPSFSFWFFKFRTAPAWARDNGYPLYAESTMVQYQFSGFI
jgi:hypothetical protein